MRKVIFFILICTSCTNSIDIELTDKYCGAVFVLISNSITNELKKVEVDKDGIGVVPVKYYKKNEGKNIVVLLNEQDITDKCNHFTYNQISTDKNEIKEYLTFYVNCNSHGDFSLNKFDEEFNRLRSNNSKVKKWLEE